MARAENQQPAYPLFIEPYTLPTSEEDRRENAGTTTAHRICEGRSVSPDSSSRCILDRLRTIKLDTPALRRNQMPSAAAGHMTRNSTPKPLISSNQNELSAFAATSQALREPSAFASSVQALRRDRETSHARQESLQQRRHHTRGVQGGTSGSLTITSPTARQAGISRGNGGGSSRPAGPMIWLPDEQVWLLADPDAINGPAAPSGVTYPHSAPLGALQEQEDVVRRGRDVAPHDGNKIAPEGHRLTRSDSSPIRSQFLSLIRPQGPEARMSSLGSTAYGYGAPDWANFGPVPGPSALEEDALWYAEQQARVKQRRDQDRFSPMLQQALTGVEIPSIGGFGPQLDVPSAKESPNGIRRASTVGGSPAATRLRRKRSGSLRSRVSIFGNEDDAAAAASMVQRDVREQLPRRRQSEGNTETPGNKQPKDASRQEDEREWLARLAAQGVATEGIFTPRESVVSASSSTAVFTGIDAVAGLPPIASRGKKEEDGGGDEDKAPSVSSSRSKIMEDFDKRRVSEWVDEQTSPSPRSSAPEDKAEVARRLAELRSEALETISPLAPSAALGATSSSRGYRPTGKRRVSNVSTIQGDDGRDSIDFKDGEVSPVSSRANSISG